MRLAGGATGLVIAVALVGCGSSGSTTPAPAVTVPVTASAPSSMNTPTSSAPSASSTLDTTTDGSDTSVTVPDVVGMNLQSAQESLRALGLRTSSSDATGQGRMQLWDRNWEVVGQSPAAGTQVSIGTSVDMSVKKIGE
jgi:beta-lactam-binding protein with PASTA domain